MRLALLLFFLAVPAWASGPEFTPGATEECLAAATDIGGREACIGLSAAACYSPEGVYSNVAIGICYGAEADYWDRRLNLAYRELLAAEMAMMEHRPETRVRAPDAVSALREMQRAWISYRDAACWYEYTTWGGGTGGGPANAACLMQVTGRQALALEARLEDRQQ